MTRRVVLIGATGEFGGRLARMLSRLAGLELIVTSRSARKAMTFATDLQPGAAATVSSASFAHGHDAQGVLSALRPWLVIDASGPFQTADYETARAAVSAGAHWIDLADAEDYILNFGLALDELCRERGVCAFTGASSTPALSFAAVAALTHGWQSVDDVEIGIYPGGGGDVGRAVINGVLSYAGTEINVQRNGKAARAVGWGKVERVHVAGIGQRWRSPVATADHALMPEAFGTANVCFYAGLESPLEHLGLVLLAQARRRGLVKDLAFLAPLLHRARNFTKIFCGDSGAMVADIKGVDENGRRQTVQWMLTAHDGDGPNVPVLAALALTKILLSREIAAGASCATKVLSLRDMEQEVEPFAITTMPASLPIQPALVG